MKRRLMEYTLFYLIRHGKKEVTSGDVPLSPSGLRQAYATAQFLQERPIQQVYSSPLRRAKEPECSITVIRFERGQYFLECLAEVKHLADTEERLSY